jgi:paraquat-inducible protein A
MCYCYSVTEHAASSGAQVTVVCRRCRRRYSLPVGSRTLLAACPRCGAAPSALWNRIRLRHNGAAAVLSVLATIVLVVAVSLPFISMSKLGSERVFSLVSGIRELFRNGNTFIGTVLLVFSLIFPFAKLAAILVATSALVPLSIATRQRLHHLAVLTGKYSLLDILVVAIMIVLVKFQGVAEVRALPGTILFCVAIFLSIAAGFCVDLDDDDDQANETVEPAA